MSAGPEDLARAIPGDPGAVLAMTAAMETALDRKLGRLRDELLRDLQSRDPRSSLDRVESAIMMMTSKLESVSRRQVEGDRWM